MSAPLLAAEPIVGVAVLLGAGLVTLLASRHRLSLLIGTQLLTLGAVRALAAAGQADLGVLALVFGLLISLVALRLAQDVTSTEQSVEPPP
jgi:multisubunit Na+/H+ antiporter MnhC subunit